jgi:hypothetical protein
MTSVVDGHAFIITVEGTDAFFPASCLMIAIEADEGQDERLPFIAHKSGAEGRGCDGWKPARTASLYPAHVLNDDALGPNTYQIGPSA